MLDVLLRNQFNNFMFWCMICSKILAIRFLHLATEITFQLPPGAFTEKLILDPVKAIRTVPTKLKKLEIRRLDI